MGCRSSVDRTWKGKRGANKLCGVLPDREWSKVGITVIPWQLGKEGPGEKCSNFTLPVPLPDVRKQWERKPVGIASWSIAAKRCTDWASRWKAVQYPTRLNVGRIVKW